VCAPVLVCCRVRCVMPTFNSFQELKQRLDQEPESVLGEREAREFRRLKLERKQEAARVQQRKRECREVREEARELFRSGKRGECYRLLDAFSSRYGGTGEARRCQGLKRSFKREAREVKEAQERVARESKARLEAEERLKTFLIRVVKAGGEVRADGSIVVKGRTDPSTRKLLRAAGYTFELGRRAWVKA